MIVDGRLYFDSHMHMHTGTSLGVHRYGFLMKSMLHIQ